MVPAKLTLPLFMRDPQHAHPAGRGPRQQHPGPAQPAIGVGRTQPLHVGGDQHPAVVDRHQPSVDALIALAMLHLGGHRPTLPVRQ
jgi:hypothetical protein